MEASMDLQKALGWVTDIFAVEGKILTTDDTRMSVPEWDSLGVLVLLSRLEEDHGIIVSADEVAKINSVREICELLKSNHAFS